MVKFMNKKEKPIQLPHLPCPKLYRVQCIWSALWPKGQSLEVGFLCYPMIGHLHVNNQHSRSDGQAGPGDRQEQGSQGWRQATPHQLHQNELENQSRRRLRVHKQEGQTRWMWEWAGNRRADPRVGTGCWGEIWDSSCWHQWHTWTHKDEAREHEGMLTVTPRAGL